MNNKKKVVTLIGSMSNWDDMIRVSEKYTRNGWVVMTPMKCSDQNISEERELELDRDIRLKIDNSDLVVVVNTNGYYGDSTASEIAYAFNKCKEVRFEYKQTFGDPRKQPIVVTLSGSRMFHEHMKNIRRTLNLAGVIVNLPSIFDYDGCEINHFTETEHEILDKLHEDKMLSSDAVLFVDIDGYVGDNTEIECLFAQKRNLKIAYLSRYIKSVD